MITESLKFYLQQEIRGYRVRLKPTALGCHYSWSHILSNTISLPKLWNFPCMCRHAQACNLIFISPDSAPFQGQLSFQQQSSCKYIIIN